MSEAIEGKPEETAQEADDAQASVVLSTASRDRKVFGIVVTAALALFFILFLIICIGIPEMKYQQAAQLMSDKQWEEAAAAFQSLNGYRDSTSRALTCAERISDEEFLNNTVTFGTYNGEPIEWIILKEEDGKKLLISKEVLDEQPYNEVNDFVTWETCTIRTWLNEDFYNAAFSDEEKAKIITTTVENPASSVYHTAGCDDTYDNVWFLSVDEVRELMPNRGNRTASTHWWLRNSGSNAGAASDVRADGTVRVQGYFVWREDSGVRPVIWASI